MKKMQMALMLAATVSAGLLGGCGNQQLAEDEPITASYVRANLTPELETVAMTPEQRKNQYARMLDSNFSQLHDDWDRLWLIDKPVGFSRYPIPNH